MASRSIEILRKNNNKKSNGSYLSDLQEFCVEVGV